METIINEIEYQIFGSLEIGDVFTTFDGILVMKISEEVENNVVCLDDGTIMTVRCTARCYVRDCVIIERTLLENLKRGAGEYE